MSEKYVVILNGHAGGGRGAARAKEVLPRLREAGRTLDPLAVAACLTLFRERGFQLA